MGIKKIWLLGLLAGWSLSAAAAPWLEQTNLFEAGQSNIFVFRIPGIVVTKHGTILVYCEARRGSRSDWADSDIWLRRSTDGGKSFSAPGKIAHVGERLPRSPVALAKKIGNAEDQTVNNPVAVVDHATGAVHFLYCVNYEHCFYRRSDDDGATFSPPVDLTATFAAFRPEYDCRVIATGPGHGIDLNNGRLLVPVWLSTGGNGHTPSVTATIYSDDHGQTWQCGAIALNTNQEWRSPNENMVAQLADGRVMMNARASSDRGRRIIAYSPDGITNWTGGRFDEKLLEPICMGSLTRYSLWPGCSKNRLLFSNPDNMTGGKAGELPGKPRARKNLSIKLSYDEGETWPVNKVLQQGASAYSDLAVLPDGTILCFYENQNNLTLAHFNLEWLTDGKEVEPRK